MSQLDPTLDRLLDQLFDEDARTRRKAAQELGKLGNPEAIADLVNVYNKDADAGVRKAAGDALRTYRQIEQRMLNKGDAAESSGPNLGPLLTRARLGLGITLAITLMINIVFIGMSIAKSLQGTPTPPAAQTVPSARNDVVTLISKRLDDTRTEATNLRKVFSVVQGMGVSGMSQDLCTQLPSSTLNKMELAPIDRITYPDLNRVTGLLNIPIVKVEDLRTSYVLLCAIKDPKQFEQTIGIRGGGAAFVTEADDVLNKDLPGAQAALKNAIDKPAPTVGPTFTATLPPTATVPTSIPTVASTQAATVAPTTAASTVGSTSGAPTAAGTPPGTEAATYSLTELHLESAPTYKYHVSITTSGTYATSNKTFKGSLDFRVAHSKSPQVSQFEVRINEGNSANAFFKPFAGPLYVAGESTYVVIDDVFYQYGNVVSTKSTTTCQAFKATPDTTAKLQDISLGDLGNVVLTATGNTSIVNGELSTEYSGKRQTGSNNEFIQNVG